jgi:DeoR/GlpR family transcriptional regulator of sugar metabolism
VEKMSAAGRRTELVRLLRARRRDTVTNLAHELGVHEQTIRRDLLTLTLDEGYLIDTKQGNGGGVFYNGRKNPHKGLFNQEQIDVLNALRKYADSHQLNVLDGMLENFA